MQPDQEIRQEEKEERRGMKRTKAMQGWRRRRRAWPSLVEEGKE
jgi:hypothetical protein